MRKVYHNALEVFFSKIAAIMLFYTEYRLRIQQVISSPKRESAGLGLLAKANCPPFNLFKAFI